MSLGFSVVAFGFHLIVLFSVSGFVFLRLVFSFWFLLLFFGFCFWFLFFVFCLVCFVCPGAFGNVQRA